MNVLIIGCGSIGALKPDKYDFPGGENILTHAHAAWKHPEIKNIAFYDNNINQSCLASEKWNNLENNCCYIHDFHSILSFSVTSTYLFEKHEIIILSVPTQTHFEYLKLLANYEPKVIIAEKPFCENLQQAKEIQEIYKNKKTKVIVNYARRFEPVHQDIKNIIKNTKIQQCKLIYTRGLKREASHAIDLFNWWFGECLAGSIINKSEALNDYSDDDKTYACWLEYEKCPFVFLEPADGRLFGIFEIDILLNNMRYIFINNGQKLLWYRAKDEPIYGNYKSLDSSTFLSKDTELTNTLYKVMNHAVQCAKTDMMPLCGIDDAIKVHEVIDCLTKESI